MIKIKMIFFISVKDGSQTIWIGWPVVMRIYASVSTRGMRRCDEVLLKDEDESVGSS
jgi:hypothetical protein